MNRREAVLELSAAFRQRDARRLARVAGEDPILALCHLDGSMRGLRDGPQEAEQVAWLVEQDRALRRRVGPIQRDADLALLRGIYSAGDLFLVVGAGISQAAGLPGWKQLVLDLLDSLLALSLPPRRRADISDTRLRLAELEGYDSGSLMEATRLAAAHFGGDLPEHLQRLLYRDVVRTRVHPAIARLVRPPEPDPAPRIFAIVTYNFDDLLEQAILEAGLGYTVHCSRLGEWVSNRGRTPARPSAVDVYHVHGFAAGGWPVDLRGIDMVFSTEQYERQYGRNASVVRAVHESFFPNAPGLILGSSLSDRYAVEQLTRTHAANPGWFNYAVMRRTDEPGGGAREPSGDELDAWSEPYRPMGLRILWIRDHAEIADLLDSIAPAAIPD